MTCLILTSSLFCACTPNDSINKASQLPVQTVKPFQSTAKTSIQLRVDLSGLSPEDQALLEKQNFTVQAELTDLPTIFPSPEPSAQATTLPTAPRAEAVAIRPQWGPLRIQANQSLTFEYIPIGQSLTVSAALNYQDAKKLTCEKGANRYFFASQRIADVGATPSVSLKVLERVNEDLSRCEVASVMGRVVSLDQKPVSGAKVRIRSLILAVPMDAQTESDRDGNYVFLQTPPGILLEIQVEAAGFANAQQQVVAKSNDNGGKEQNHYDFTLSPIQ